MTKLTDADMKIVIEEIERVAERRGYQRAIDALRAEGERAFKLGGIEHGRARHEVKGWDPYDIAADYLESA